ncbi:repulsive guidance molecule B-like [Conger conger]|uniref:repulsive guidance molecule B-like n=1 Tax=Conger conger TaxID=82655 RepID=UPI002A5A2070|nr:repulsive guidance molecule B-like [Conger conger]
MLLCGQGGARTTYRGPVSRYWRKSASVSSVEHPSASLQRPGWMVMGKSGFYYSGADCLIHASSICLLSLSVLLALSSWAEIGDCQAQHSQCHIQKCTTNFVSLTSHLNPSLYGFETEFCTALRTYSACTRHTSKSCRGNLVFHSAMLGISDLMTQRNCSKDGPTSPTQLQAPAGPCDYHGRQQGLGASENSHLSNLFCGLFGDPHLRTFKDDFQTCKVEGAWPLIDNNYLSVQVTNIPLVPGSHATATIKVTVIFKAQQDCTEQKVYQAVAGDLPAAFTDGTVSGGGSGGRSLWIVEEAAGRHVEIQAGYIGTTVIVRQLGHYLTLAARVPRDVAMAFDDSQDLQLCVNGCPQAERIDRDGHLPLPDLGPRWAGPQHQYRQLHPRASQGLVAALHHDFTLEAAVGACQARLEVKDIYFHSCVFDLLTTGDSNFTSAAYNALKDMETLHPMRERWRIFPRSYSPVPSHLHHRLLLLCCLFPVFLLDFLK